MIFLIATLVASSVASKFIKRAYFGQIGLILFMLICFKFFRKCRAYLCFHSDEQIAAHLQASIMFAVSSIASCVYLAAETFGCVNIFEESECELLFHCNYCVIAHLTSGIVFFISVGFTFAHQGWLDTLTLRNCDVSALIRTFSSMIPTILVLLVFGIRPKDSTYTFTSIEMEENTSKIMYYMRYYIGFSWLILIGYHYHPIQELLHIEEQRRETGMSEVQIKVRQTAMSD